MSWGSRGFGSFPWGGRVKQAGTPVGIPSLIGTPATYYTNTAVALDVLTISITIPSGPNRILIVGIGDFQETDTYTSPTFAGSPMTLYARVDPWYSGDRVLIYYQVNPPVGTANISLTLGATIGGSYDMGLAACVFQNVNQASPWNGSAVTIPEASTSPWTADIGSATNELIVCIFNDWTTGGDPHGATPYGAGTEIIKSSYGLYQDNASIESYVGTGSTITAGWQYGTPVESAGPGLVGRLVYQGAGGLGGGLLLMFCH